MERERRIDRLLLAADLIGYTAAYFLSLRLRYTGAFPPWMRAFYRSVFVASMLLFVLLHFLQRAGGRRGLTEESDPVDIAVDTVRNMVFHIVLLSVYLVVTGTAERISRLFLGILFVLEIIVLCIVRFLAVRCLSHFFRKSKSEEGLRVLAAAAADKLPEAQARLAVEEKAGVRPVGGMALSFPLTDESLAAAFAPFAEEKVQCVWLLPEGAGDADVKLLSSFLAGKKIELRMALYQDGIPAPKSALTVRSGAAVLKISALKERCPVLGVNYCVTNVGEAVFYVRRHLDDLRGSYLCFSNVHTTVMAKESEAYKNVQNSSAFTFPDGMPIAQRQYQKGFVQAQRVSGPDFMGNMFLSSMDGKVRHYFYGSTEETIALLQEKLPKAYPGIELAGFYSPPFRALTEEEDAEIIRRINEAKPDIVWIGLGAPKQENWMYAHRG